MRYHYTVAKIRRLTIPRVVEDKEKPEPSYIAVEM